MVVPSWLVVVEVVGLVPILRLSQVKGAAPPSMVRVAWVGALTSWYCWEAVMVPVAEKVPGVTEATVMPTDVSWSLITLNETVPETGA